MVQLFLVSVYVLFCFLVGSILPMVMESRYFGGWVHQEQQQQRRAQDPLLMVGSVEQRGTATVHQQPNTSTGTTLLIGPSIQKPVLRKMATSQTSVSMLHRVESVTVRAKDDDDSLGQEEEKAALQRKDGHDFSHCYFRDYPRPPPSLFHQEHWTSLPLVGEVFAFPDRSHVFIAAEGRKHCQAVYAAAHEHFYSTKEHGPVQFNCIFDFDGSVTLSQPIHTRLPIHRPRNFGFVPILCPIPTHLQALMPNSGARWTRQHLTLQARKDLITDQPFVANDSATTKTPALTHLPICSNAWPPEDGDNAKKNQPNTTRTKNYTISLMTRISLSYLRGLGKHERLSIQRYEFVTWIEYHWSVLGVEHFYIYDDSPSPHNSTLRQWCQPYMDQDILTYVYYPYEDIDCDDNDSLMSGQIMYMGQVISTNTALRRYEHETTWMGHWDVDEFLLIPSIFKNPLQNSSSAGTTTTTTMRDFLHKYGNEKSKEDQFYDEISFLRPTYGPCSGPENHNTGSIINNNNSKEESNNDTTTIPSLFLKRNRCLRPIPIPKGIYRTSSVLHFRVHKALVRMDGSHQVRRRNIPMTVAHLAHFQKGIKVAGKTFSIPSPPSFFHDDWLEPLRRRVKRAMIGVETMR